jgi:hypothetical protein
MKRSGHQKKKHQNRKKKDVRRGMGQGREGGAGSLCVVGIDHLVVQPQVSGLHMGETLEGPNLIKFPY